MLKSIHGVIAAALLLAVPVATAFAAEKEDPKKFNYRPLPVDVACMSGYHPTVNKDGENVFPCIADAEIVAPPKGSVAVKAAPIVKAN